MKMHQLRYVVAVARTRNFSRKGVSPEYLHKSGYGLEFCHAEAIAD